MNSLLPHRSIATTPQTPVVSWLLRHGTAAITCELDMKADRSFELSVFPSWSSCPSLVERFDGAMAAMERHAQVANHLRSAGWSVVRGKQ